MPRELIKIVCTAVVLIKDKDGIIVGESTSEPIACYSSDDMVAFFLRVKKEVQEQNVAERPRRKNASS
jgi:hypothetical protein